MSIGQQVVQQVNRINNEVETQKTLMENIDGMLDDLGAERVDGGMQLETCTVTVEYRIPAMGDGCYPDGALTTLANDGSLSYVRLGEVATPNGWTEGDTVTGGHPYIAVIENVVINSTLTMYNNSDSTGFVNINAVCENGAEVIYSSGYNAGIILRITGDCKISINMES